MDRLSLLLTFMTGAVLVGSFVIVVFALGMFSMTTLFIAAVAGLLLTWPAAYVISRKIKREDPGWDETRLKRTDSVPRPSDPEV